MDWRSLKRKCWEHGRIMSEKVTSENKSQGIGSDDLTRSEVNDKRDEGIGTEESVLQYESAEGGNSFADGISSAISLQGEASFQPKYRKCGDTPSTSIANPECFVSDEKKYYSDDLRVSRQGGDKGKSIVRMGEGSSRCIDDESQICETLEEHLLEFGCRLGYTCSEYGIDGSNQCEDKEIEELFGLGQENFILSSGQWNTNEGNFSATGSLS